MAPLQVRRRFLHRPGHRYRWFVCLRPNASGFDFYWISTLNVEPPKWNTSTSCFVVGF